MRALGLTLALISSSALAGCDCGRGGNEADDDDDTDGDGGVEGDGSVERRGRGGDNRAPAITSEPPLEATEGESYRYQPRFDDLDGDILSAELPTAPEGMTISESTGAIFWLPGERAAGSADVRLVVTDEAGATAEQEWTITVHAHDAPPVIRSVPDPNASQGQTWTYAAVADDPDGDTLAWSLVESPAGMTVGADGMVEWAAAGEGGQRVTLRVSDPGGGTDEQSFQVVVPVAGDVSGPTVSITSPAAGATLAMEFEVVGSVQDAALAEWELRACATARPDECHELHRSNLPVQNATLGRGTTHGLPPGDWELVLEARDRTGARAETRQPVVVPIDQQLGAIRIAFVDLQVPLGALDLQIVRSYDGSSRTDGDFGVGWAMETTYEAPDGANPRAELPAGGVDGDRNCVADIFGGSCDILQVDLITPEDVTYPTVNNPVYQQSIAGGTIWSDVWESAFGTTVVAYDDGGQPYGDLLMLSGETQFVTWPDEEPYDPAELHLTDEAGRVFEYDARTGAFQGFTDEQGRWFPWQGGGATLEDILDITRNGAGHVTSISDPEVGDTITYHYDEHENLVSVTFNGIYEGEEQTFRYAQFCTRPEGGLAGCADDWRMVGYDANGMALENVEYDEQGRILRRTDGSGAVTEWQYDDENRIVRVVRPSGATTTIHYDELGRVLDVTDPLGNTITNEYEGSSRQPSRRRDARGNVTSLTYENGEIASVTDESGTRSVEYDPDGLPTRLTNEEGQTTSFEWTDSAVVARGPDGQVVQAEDFDPATGKTTRTVDAEGVETSYEYGDDNGLLARMQDSSGAEETYAYDARGLQVTVTDALTGETFVERRDPAGQVRGITTADGTSIDYTYDAHGLPIRAETDGLEVRVHTDPSGRMVGESVNGERKSRTRYDGDGNVVAIQPSDGAGKLFDLDAVGRIVAVHDENGVTTMQYDSVGNMVRRVKPDGSDEELEHDARGRVVAWREAEGPPFQFEYDGRGNLTSVIDPLDRELRVSYDPYGQVTGTALPGVALETIERDHGATALQDLVNPSDQTEPEQGPIKSWTAPWGSRWTYTRDGASGLTIADPAGRATTYATTPEARTITMGAATWRWETDESAGTAAYVTPEGRRTETLALPDGTRTTLPDGTSFDRVREGDDEVLRLADGTEERATVGPRGIVATSNAEVGVSYEYDYAGRLTKVANDDGAEVRYRWGESGQVEQVVVVTPDDVERVIAYAWDATGHIASMTDPEGGVTQYGWDESGRLILVDRPNGVSTVLEYGPLATPTSITHRRGDQVLKVSEVEYDASGRVTHRTEKTGQYTYEYDQLGALASEEGPDQSITWDRNQVGDIVGERTDGDHVDWTRDRDGRLISIGSEAIQFDGRGNRTAGLGRRFTWDARSRLTEADDTELAYDAKGNLVRWTGEDGTKKCLFVPNLVSPNREHEVCVALYDDSGAGAAIAFDPMGVAGTFGETARYAQRGLVGSVVGVTDEEGTLVGERDFDAYGQPVGETGESFLFGYAGELTVSGLVYLRSRWYDPATREFLSIEPEAPTDGAPASLSAYGYVVRGDTWRPNNGNPLSNVDPDGRQTLGETMAVMGTSNQLRAMLAAAQFCAKGAAKAWLKTLIKDFIVKLAMQFVLSGVSAVLGPVLGNLAGMVVNAGDFGSHMRQQVGRALCNGNGWRDAFGQWGDLIGIVASNVLFEVGINSCGRLAHQHGSEPFYSCAQSNASLHLPSNNILYGTQLDVLLGDRLAIELKRSIAYHAENPNRIYVQAAKYGMWGANDGGIHFFMVVASSNLGPRNIRMKMMQAALRPSTWSADLHCAEPYPSVASLILFYGYDAGARRYRFIFPRTSDLKALVKGCATGGASS